MPTGARTAIEKRIRDFGTRRIQAMNGNGTKGASHPVELESTDFPTELGDEVRCIYDPEANQLIYEPAEGEND